jgi:hypothetical protein
MPWSQLIFDNPILIKHVRSRLRLGQTIPSVVVIGVLSLCVVWAGQSIGWIGPATAATVLVIAQVVLLTLMGSNQLNSSLGRAKESGILDFHRVSPLPPAFVTLGFFLGAPIREYLLAAVILPFATFSAYFAHISGPWRGLLWVLQLEVALIVSSWLLHAIVMLSCFARKKPRGSVVGTVVTVIVLLYVVYGLVAGSYLGARALLEDDYFLNFFGTMIPWLPWILIFELPVIGFLGLACVRKMKAENSHAFTKRQAIACMATLVFLATAGLWNLAPKVGVLDSASGPTATEVVLVAAVYVLSFTAMMLTATITPHSNEYIKGLLRARHEGRKRPSPWSDAGSNRVALFILCAIVLVGATILTKRIGREIPNSWSGPAWRSDEIRAAREVHLSRPIAVGVLTAAYVGLGLQYFLLRSPRSGRVLMALFLFVAWLLPPLAGAIAGLASPTAQSISLPILATSPIFGLAISGGFNRSIAGADSAQLFALAPPITFAFFFNYLLVVTQRKLDRAARAGDERAVRAAGGPRL